MEQVWAILLAVQLVQVLEDVRVLMSEADLEY
jgi:hypothetical protein